MQRERNVEPLLARTLTLLVQALDARQALAGGGQRALRGVSAEKEVFTLDDAG